MENAGQVFRRDIIRSLIIILLYQVESIYRKNVRHEPLDVRPGKDKILSDFQELLRRNFYKEHKVSFYAAALLITTDQAR